MRLRWLTQALADLCGIHDYIAKDNPTAARRVVGEIRREVEILATEHAKVLERSQDPVKKEGSELATNCSQLKMQSADGKNHLREQILKGEFCNEKN